MATLTVEQAAKAVVEAQAKFTADSQSDTYKNQLDNLKKDQALVKDAEDRLDSAKIQVEKDQAALDEVAAPLNKALDNLAAALAAARPVVKP